jgi:hypothetical protein
MQGRGGATTTSFDEFADRMTPGDASPANA